MRHQRGFTLIELMIVVAIIAILVAVGYPAYTDQVRKSRRADGKAALQQAMNHQERFYTSNNAYTDDLGNLDAYTAEPAASQEGWYEVIAEFCDPGDDQCVELTAKPQNAQATDMCGDFTLTSRGERGLENQDGGVTADDCW